MDSLKRRLTDLWERQTTTSGPPRPSPWPGELSDRMVVTISEPMKLSGTVLAPGKYAFLMLDSGAEHNLVQIFNEDQTKLIATLTSVSDN
ncbi:MAG: hypothetical protein ABSF71_07890 [Terriglobia bacterium]|jgi:hypothetical protein